MRNSTRLFCSKSGPKILKNFPEITSADIKYLRKFHGTWFSRSEDIKFHRKKHVFGHISHCDRDGKLKFVGYGFLMVPNNFHLPDFKSVIGADPLFLPG